MIKLREWIAAIIFFAGIAGIFTLFSDGFEWAMLAATAFSFIAAYIIWPSKRLGQRHDDGRIADIFEVLIEFPIELFFWIIRLFGRMLGGKGDGVDLDI